MPRRLQNGDGDKVAKMVLDGGDPCDVASAFGISRKAVDTCCYRYRKANGLRVEQPGRNLKPQTGKRKRRSAVDRGPMQNSTKGRPFSLERKENAKGPNPMFAISEPDPMEVVLVRCGCGIQVPRDQLANHQAEPVRCKNAKKRSSFVRWEWVKEAA